jgi:capsular exopolysaccharide synthesis family protein
MEDSKKLETTVDGAIVEPNDEESSFNLRTVYSIFILNWPWFLLSLFIFICGALIYLRYTDPVYSVSMKMYINDEVNNRRPSNQMLSNMQDMGFISNSTGIENEVEILQTRRLAEEAVKDLKIYTEYYSNGRLKRCLVYKYQPMNVDLDEESLEELDKAAPFGFSFVVTRNNNKYDVESENCLPFKGSFTNMPDSIETPYGILIFTTNVIEGVQPMANGQKLFVTITPPKIMAARYAKSLSADPTSKMTSIALITLNDKSVERGIDYLNQLAICYNRQANADKNEIAFKTEEFINSRLEKINNELGMTESELEEYKRTHSLTELRLDATQTLTQSNQYAAKLAEANTQIMLLDYLREHVNDPANKYQIIPSNVGMSDPISASLINEYNKTVQEREKMLRSASENAPQVITLTNALDNLTASIKTALQQARRSADITRQGIESQYAAYSSRISSTPEQERILTQIGRQQEVKSGLYLMLLQKREENSISLAATADKGRVIERPALAGKVSPKSSLILTAAILLGFLIPLFLIYLFQVLRYKIEGHEDVVRLTKLPIVAEVAVASESVKSSAGIVVQENKNNQIDEIFRSMRTNIQFMMTSDQKVILFTSSTSGEGKTFNAANLAMSFALLGKKVILMGLDIRKPALGRLFDITDRDRGITSLLAKAQVTEQDLMANIQPSGINANLDLLLAGPTPPNPTELLARQNLTDIVTMLRGIYDYIILDTAPVGLVTDTLQIGKVADVTAFVCRADYTPKSSFGFINTLAAEKKMPNMCIVLNGIDMSKKKYGYYYGYGKYGKYGRYGSYGRYSSYGSYGSYGNYGNYAESHYGDKSDNSIKLKKRN